MTAWRMVDGVEAGPVYLMRALSLDGSAHEIFVRAVETIFDMISDIVATEPEPLPQVGEREAFRRRTPAESALPAYGRLPSLYDHIRTLDADASPHAYIDHGDYRFSDTEPVIEGAELTTRRHTVLRVEEES